MNCSDIDPRKLTRHHRNGWELLLAHAICLVCPLLVHSYPPRSLQATSEWKLVGGGYSSLMRLINWKQTDLVFPKKPRSCCAVPEREAVKRACFFFFFFFSLVNMTSHSYVKRVDVLTCIIHAHTYSLAHVTRDCAQNGTVTVNETAIFFLQGERTTQKHLWCD